MGGRVMNRLLGKIFEESVRSLAFAVIVALHVLVHYSLELVTPDLDRFQILKDVVLGIVFVAFMVVYVAMSYEIVAVFVPSLKSHSKSFRSARRPTQASDTAGKPEPLPSPPQLPTRAAELLLPRKHRIEFLGDLEQEYERRVSKGPRAADRWYFSEVAKETFPTLWKLVLLPAIEKVASEAVKRLIGG